MPDHLIPADPFTATIRTIACPDCIERPWLNLTSPNPGHPEVCPTCAGYGNILHPEEVALTKVYQQKMIDQEVYDLKRRMMGKADWSDLKPWPEYVEGRWSA